MPDTLPVKIDNRIISTVFNDIRQGVVILTSQRKVFYVNESAKLILGAGITDLIEKDISEVLHVFDNSGPISTDVICPESIIDVEGTVFKGESLTLKAFDSQDRVINLWFRKVRGGYESNIGGVIVMENTSQISDLEKMKLDFVSISAHSLRTPVSVIRGYVQLLLSQKTLDKLDDTEITSLNSIGKSIEELKDLIENLLNIARISDGKLTVSLTAINLENVVKKEVQDKVGAARYKGLQLIFVPPAAPLPRVYSDILKIHQVLGPIVDNALKFTDTGQVTIWIERVGDYLRVYIQDTGRGIPEADKPHIFTKFFRVKKEALDMEYGHGVGLFVAQKIAEAMRARIGFDSVSGQGSTFFVDIPIFENDLGMGLPVQKIF